MGEHREIERLLKKEPVGVDEDGGELRPHEIHHGGTPTEMAVEQKKYFSGVIFSQSNQLMRGGQIAIEMQQGRSLGPGLPPRKLQLAASRNGFLLRSGIYIICR